MMNMNQNIIKILIITIIMATLEPHVEGCGGISPFEPGSVLNKHRTQYLVCILLHARRLARNACFRYRAMYGHKHDHQSHTIRYDSMHSNAKVRI
jgi:hypothetical protein